jgi:hypothetical protein
MKNILPFLALILATTATTPASPNPFHFERPTNGDIIATLPGSHEQLFAFDVGVCDHLAIVTRSKAPGYIRFYFEITKDAHPAPGGESGSCVVLVGTRNESRNIPYAVPVAAR